MKFKISLILLFLSITKTNYSSECYPENVDWKQVFEIAQRGGINNIFFYENLPAAAKAGDLAEVERILERLDFDEVRALATNARMHFLHHWLARLSFSLHILALETHNDVYDDIAELINISWETYTLKNPTFTVVSERVGLVEKLSELDEALKRNAANDELVALRNVIDRVLLRMRSGLQVGRMLERKINDLFRRYDERLAAGSAAGPA